MGMRLHLYVLARLNMHVWHPALMLTSPMKDFIVCEVCGDRTKLSAFKVSADKQNICLPTLMLIWIVWRQMSCVTNFLQSE